jgi:hypothetical protein
LVRDTDLKLEVKTHHILRGVGEWDIVIRRGEQVRECEVIGETSMLRLIRSVVWR